ncbi:putative nucleic-acid-binding protein containing a Zn-ribbon [Variovorax sp. SRS16]|uniref:Zn-ribbon domain-containing OB-fold protein n=1 Tax=Variovorax sp. SRS16 TaxID=282217 RepID=UPI0013185471|nr:OB-fold domain-containing protein [Variovorax sp. SRS16]VTU22709.1 putative nucleic-acid-binding protein containing a Zn-ribbon [Variovorax sp. SRS16]
MNTSLLDLPLPRPTLLTQPFWDAARAHRLIIQRCDRCGRLRFYPSEGCTHCASPDFTWIDVSGRGHVYSWIVVRRSVDPAWQRRAPFVSAIIELDEQRGVLVPGLLTDIAPEQVRADLPVQVWFEQVSPEISMPRWRPAGTEA